MQARSQAENVTNNVKVAFLCEASLRRVPLGDQKDKLANARWAPLLKFKSHLLELRFILEFNGSAMTISDDELAVLVEVTGTFENSGDPYEG